MSENTKNDKLLALSDNAPWEKMPQETDLWYERFFLYLTLGPTRSIPQLIQNLGMSPASASSFYPISKKFSWKQRAQAWDSLQHEKELMAISEEKVQSKIRRTSFLNKLLVKMEDRLETDLELDQLTWRDLGPVAKTVLEQLRYEYEGDPNLQQQQMQEVNFTLNIPKPLHEKDDENDDEFENIIDIG
jgi:hypothetical protein